jgi:hypothetical protein
MYRARTLLFWVNAIIQCDFSIGKRTSGNPTSSNNDIELFRKFENFGFSGRGAE